jgi:4-oxalocrotonate tautomerase
MPYVIVYQLDGRPIEVKRRLVKEVTEAVSRVLSVPPGEVAVCIAELARENWAHGGVLAADRAPPAKPAGKGGG